MKEELAVEWFANRISHGGLVSKKQFDELLEQAKEMEKEYIVKAHYQGYRSSIGTTEISEQYYNETFKQEQ
jgi:ribonuclease HII